MVYNDYKDWGWEPFVRSWISRIYYSKDPLLIINGVFLPDTQKRKGSRFQDSVWNYFSLYLNMILEFKRLNCMEIVECCEINLVASLCKMLDVFATKENGVNAADEVQDGFYLVQYTGWARDQSLSGALSKMF